MIGQMNLRMKCRMVSMLMTIFMLSCLPKLSLALDQVEKAAIEAVVARYTEAWNRHDMQDFSKVFAVDADFVNVFGQKFSGRPEIERRHEFIHETFLRDSQMKIQQVTLREIRPGIVIGHVNWFLKGYREPHGPRGMAPEDREGIFTQVFVKNGGAWEIAASQNTFLKGRP